MQELLAEGTAALGLLARQDLAAAAPMAAVLEAPQLFDLTRGLQSVRLLLMPPLPLPFAPLAMHRTLLSSPAQIKT
jgi:hypothetical protein